MPRKPDWDAGVGAAGECVQLSITLRLHASARRRPGPADAAEPGPAVKSEADVPPTVEAAEDGARGIKRERDDDAGPAPKVEGEGAPPEDREVDVKKEEGGEDEDEESLERDAADLIDGFRAGAEESAADAAASEDALKTFLDDMRAVDRSNEVERILWAFKLNPYDKLGLRFTATESEVRKQYRCAPPLVLDAAGVLAPSMRPWRCRVSDVLARNHVCVCNDLICALALDTALQRASCDARFDFAPSAPSRPMWRAARALLSVGRDAPRGRALCDGCYTCAGRSRC